MSKIIIIIIIIVVHGFSKIYEMIVVMQGRI